MGVTLGINDDYWHAIIAAFIYVAVGTIYFIWLGVNGLAFRLTFILAVPIIMFLQAMNESMEAISPNLIKNYKSLKNFQANSRKDWRMVIIGTVLGLLIISGVMVFSRIYNQWF